MSYCTLCDDYGHSRHDHRPCGMTLATKVIVTKRCENPLPCNEHGNEAYYEPCSPGNHICKIDSCSVCEEIMYWVDCPTGGWWKHVDHPADDHDGEALIPIHANEEDYYPYEPVFCPRCSCRPCLCVPVATKDGMSEACWSGNHYRCNDTTPDCRCERCHIVDPLPAPLVADPALITYPKIYDGSGPHVWKRFVDTLRQEKDKWK